tara:strand:+ start:190 stop:486 length:297 start_codon:yes stop_codon:yes gene_type:complete
MDLIHDLEEHQPFVIRYMVGQREEKDVPFFLSSVLEAKDVAHATLRMALQMNEEDNGAAEIFDEEGSKIGRMAVLLDFSGALDHEHWTWFDGEIPPLQ